MMKHTSKALFAILVASLVASVSSVAQTPEPQSLGTFRDWAAFAFNHDGGRVCYIASQPKEAKGNYTLRGDVWALVTHRSPGGSRDIIEIVAGYTYLKDSTVTITIGDRSYDLFTQEEKAWAYTREDERKIVASMKAGVNMVIEGRSWRGTETTDSYSLLGFTAAYDVISEACPN